MKRICYYHAGCPDGFGAAWSAWRAWGGKGRYIARGHDDRVDATTVDGAHLVFADIAPRNDEWRELAEVASHLVVLDHHVSALERFTEDPTLAHVLREGGHLAHFDLEHSGAMLAWMHFHADDPAPELIRYVEDQDLWAWKLPRSEEVNAAIDSHPFDFETWDSLSALGADALAQQGEPILRADALAVQRALQTARPVALREGRIEAVNATRNRSSIGHELAKRAAFGVAWGLVYRVTGERVDASIYSIGDVDVAAVAKGFGGGGHRNASGFSLSLRRWLELIV